MNRLVEFIHNYDLMMLDPCMKEVYGKSDFFNVGYWLPDTSSQLEACENLVERLLKTVPLESARVLDVGCGYGATTRSVKRFLPQASVTGINISEKQLQRCKIAALDCEFALMDAANLSFRHHSFDCVISIEAAFHFHTRERFLKEAFRVLQNGGYLVLSDILFSSTRWVGDWMVPYENTIQTLEEYGAILDSTGFQNIELVDVTVECWKAFCLARIQFAREQFDTGTLNLRSFQEKMFYLEGLLNHSLEYYVLVSAQKPVVSLENSPN
jgi:cyclopropane fatty-acyl-phospholipid synthase-like methyltransferase